MSTREVLFSDPNGSLPAVQRRPIEEADTPETSALFRGNSYEAISLVTTADPVLESADVTMPANKSQHFADIEIDDDAVAGVVEVVLPLEGRQEGDVLHLHLQFVNDAPTDVNFVDNATEPVTVGTFALGTVADEYDVTFIFTDGAWVQFGQANHLLTS